MGPELPSVRQDGPGTSEAPEHNSFATEPSRLRLLLADWAVPPRQLLRGPRAGVRFVVAVGVSSALALSLLVPLAKDFKEAVILRKPVGLYKPKSAAAKAIVALAEEMVARLDTRVARDGERRVA